MKKAVLFILSCLLFIVYCFGCAEQTPTPGIPVTVHTLAGSEDRFPLREEIRICPEGEDPLRFALGELSELFPNGLDADGAALQDGILRIAFAGETDKLVGLPLTLARACVVLTLTGLDGVDEVLLASGGQEQLFRADDFVLGSLVLTDTEQNVTLYFADIGGECTAAETRTLIVQETDTVERYLNYILEELIAGPQRSGLLPVFPEGTKLLSVIVSGRDCIVNLSRDFLTLREDGSPALTLTCLYRSVTAQEGIESLTLWIDGQPQNIYFGLDTSEPLTDENTAWLLP
ncbi:MAG: GerMN domain-containing protein [Oscillospiraceae bacterium]|jgi:germination protein M|nr:GerMN domain-containing protein [Oscillospiraceae bacterium]